MFAPNVALTSPTMPVPVRAVRPMQSKLAFLLDRIVGQLEAQLGT